MISVKIEEETLIDLLIDRIKYWTNDPDTIELFEDYYTERVNCGCFEGVELDVSMIVDNDYVNNFSVMEKDDPEYEWALENEDRIYGKLENGTILVYRGY